MTKTKASVNRIRGRKLQAIRKRHFEQHPLCVMCKKNGLITIATELDHIKALCNGGTDTPDNRQGLCLSCHAIKTSKDLGHRSIKSIGIDGWPLD